MFVYMEATLCIHVEHESYVSSVHEGLLITSISEHDLGIVQNPNYVRMFWIQDVPDASINELKKRKLIEARYLCFLLKIYFGLDRLLHVHFCEYCECHQIQQVTTYHHLSIMAVLHIFTSECFFLYL